VIRSAVGWLVFTLFISIGMPAADLTPERARFELALPVDATTLPPGPYLVSGTLELDGRTFGSFRRIRRLHLPCPKPPCAAVAQAEVPFKNVTEEQVRAFLDAGLALAARTEFKTPGSGEVRRTAIPLRLDRTALGLEPGDLEPFVRIAERTLGGATGELSLTLRFTNPFVFPARLTRLDLTVRPTGSRTSYPLTSAPDLALPPGETEHTASVKLKAEDILVLVSTKVLQEQYTLSVDARVAGSLTVELAGRTVELEWPE
jgi:hypothetical protein